MNGNKKKLKDSSGHYILPITHPSAVIDENGKTLSEKLQEMGEGDGGIPSEHTHTIDDITGVNTANKSNGNVLTYDATVGELTLKPLPISSGEEVTNLNALIDVDTASRIPTEGDTLTFTNGVWKPNKPTYQANAEIPLFIETFADGKNLPIHAKIVQFPTPWNGYRYWMAYTPWPDDINENPSIAVSNDLLEWITPPGLNNPIVVRDPSWVYYEYYSDTDLIYNPTTGKLECWYRWCSHPEKVEKIHRRVSSDGRNWSEEETLKEVSNTGNYTHMLAPSVIYENDTYRIWVTDSIANKIKYYESSDGYNWQFISDVVNVVDWHFKMERTDKGIEYLGGGGKNLTHAISQDGITFTDKKIILTTGNRGNFDDQTIYLACMVKVDKKYYVFYTGRGQLTTAKGIGLTISTVDDDITSLRGLTAGSYMQMAKPLTAGTLGQRPTNTAPIGFCYFDTSHGKPIWKKNKTMWVDASGNIV